MNRRRSGTTSLGNCGSSDPCCSRRAGRSSCTRTRLSNQRRPYRTCLRHTARHTSMQHTAPCSSTSSWPHSRRCTKARIRTTPPHTKDCPSIQRCRGPFRTRPDTHMTTRLCSERRTGWLRHTRRDHGRTEHRRTRSHTAFPVDRKTDRLRDRPSCTFPPRTPRCRWRGTPPHRPAPFPAVRPAVPCPAVRRARWRQGGCRRPTEEGSPGRCLHPWGPARQEEWSLPVPRQHLGYRPSRRSRASLHQPSGPHRR